MGKEITLSVTICTYQPQGIGRVAMMNLPRVEGVEYVVSWQEHNDAKIPAELSREDIVVTRCGKPGLSNNRNNAITHARGEIILIGDDDLVYCEKNLLDIIDAFKTHPDADLACFKYASKYYNKPYPPSVVRIPPVPRNFNPCSYEIAFRRKHALTETPLLFNPAFGLGAGFFKAGEEDLLFLRAIRLGLVCYFFPIVITFHNGISTGLRPVSDLGTLHASGAVIALTHPLTFPPRIIVNAWRIRQKKRAPFHKALTAMFRGAFTALSDKVIRRYALLP